MKKRQQCLSLTTIESIAKVRHYLLSNIKNELNFVHVPNTEDTIINAHTNTSYIMHIICAFIILIMFCSFFVYF